LRVHTSACAALPGSPSCTTGSVELAQIAKQARNAAGDWYEDGGSNVRFNYKGTTSSGPNVDGVPELYLMGTTSCTPTGGTAALTMRASFSRFVDAGLAPAGSEDWIVLMVNGPSCPKTWTFYDSDVAEAASDFQTTLLHEFGHVLGLGHPEYCAQTDVETVMSNFPFNYKRFLTKHDVLSLRSLYTTRSGTLEFRQRETDTAGWTTGSPALSFSGIRHRVGSATSNARAVGTTGSIGFAYLNSFQRPSFRKGTSSGWASGIMPDSSTTAGFSYQPPAVAAGNGRYLVSWLSGESRMIWHTTSWDWNTMNMRKIRYAISTDDGATFPSSSQANVMSGGVEITTLHNGISAAHDPWRARWVLSWLDAAGKIVIATMAEDGSSQVVSSLDYASLDAPGIACGSGGTGVPFNCVLAWTATGASEPMNRLHSIHFGVTSSGGISLAPELIISSYVAYQTPYVANVPTLYASENWLMSYGSDVSWLSTMTKTNATSASWGGRELVIASPYSQSASVGSIPTFIAARWGRRWNMFFVTTP
jgi:hypothetical protein